LIGAVRTLVLGGIRSGKSRWAEDAVAGRDLVRYIATGRSGEGDPAWEQRIGDHRRRRPSDWQTVETPDVASQLRTDLHTPALVDDLGGWLTAALDRRGWDAGSIQPDVDDLVAAVRSFPGTLALVSPEVGLSLVPTTPAGRRFADELGTLNQRIADCCERVVLVIAGQPVWIKETS
jgi:adenosylcobinamide kinase/adenosylcobinamide-phosphate guanylyltransferase